MQNLLVQLNSYTPLPREICQIIIKLSRMEEIVVIIFDSWGSGVKLFTDNESAVNALLEYTSKNKILKYEYKRQNNGGRYLDGDLIGSPDTQVSSDKGRPYTRNDFSDIVTNDKAERFSTYCEIKVNHVKLDEPI